VTKVTVLFAGFRHIRLVNRGNPERRFSMTQNIGNIDRIIRIILGVGIIALGIVFKSWLGLLGIIPLATAAVRTCPLYLPFGISTKKKA
jgi:hypothetical protein